MSLLTTNEHTRVSARLRALLGTRLGAAADRIVDAWEAAFNLTDECAMLLPFNVLGAWAVDGDGVQTNGGGLVGDAPDTLTALAAAYAVVYDKGTTSYAKLSLANTTLPAIYAANFQCFPDADGVDDAVYFGNSIQFCELGINVSATVATYAADSCVWEYYKTGGTWASLSVLHDNTDNTAYDGKRPFQRDGALVFEPPTDWEATEVDGTTAYWIRCRVSAAQVTIIPILSDEPAVVKGKHPWRPPYNGTLKAVTINDSASTLHTGADVIFVLYDSVSGESRSFTFAQDIRRERIACSEDWDLTTDARISVFVVQEDGTNEPTMVNLELEYVYTPS